MKAAMLIDSRLDFLSAARSAHQRRDWSASYEAFDLASRYAPLPTDDLDAFAFAAWRLGHLREASRAAERVFAELTRTDPLAAAMKPTIWLWPGWFGGTSTSARVG
ncbi:hypothetical protein C6A87_017410 [Mycobacterium sp. ITM-2016-00317]|uniref:hypothetical protein n=1 Tax=Mycobacterium sp. ITM-2016-00317 TaxID=2099694 RepID=UPI00287FEEFD|nr:hypothetical protein [Mycobacterium sp. ITM-2016-00317]WNG85713.1 hypothetical protein C6A87_017410 [Mycobacterium sp. ITM-2016-00317]